VALTISELWLGCNDGLQLGLFSMLLGLRFWFALINGLREWLAGVAG
jgi:hypothetical protein